MLEEELELHKKVFERIRVRWPFNPEGNLNYVAIYRIAADVLQLIEDELALDRARQQKLNVGAGDRKGV